MASVVGQLVVDGLAMGMIYVILSAGIVFIMSVSGIFYLAYGQFYMVGGYMTWTAAQMLGLPFPLAVLVAVLTTAVMGLLTYRFIYVYTTYSKQKFNATIVAGIGLLLIMGQGGMLVFGTTARSIPSVFPGVISVLGITFAEDKAALVVIGVTVTVLLFLLYEKTKIGRAMRAVSFSTDAASLQGINPKAICLASVVIGTALAGFAGGIMAPSYGLYPTMGTSVILSIMLIAMFGGIDSLLGAVLAALIVGQALSFGQFLVGAWAQVVVFLIVGVIIFFKPGGLLGSGREFGF